MKKLIYGCLFLALVGICIISCKKKVVDSPEKSQNTASLITDSQKSNNNVIIDEYNCGHYHNEAVKFILSDLETMSQTEINSNLQSSAYISGKFKQYFDINNLILPSDTALIEWFSISESVTIADFTSNPVFSDNQTQILNLCFAKLSIVDADFEKADELINFLKAKLLSIETQSTSQGRTIALATINQLISSTELWIVEGEINFFNDIGYNTFFSRADRPSNSQVLAADGKGLGLSLLYGGWSSPAGWAGSLFVGAGASFGEYIDSYWWPF